MTSPFSIYIPVGITYKDYKAEYFAAYIDCGAGICICKPECYPKEYHQDLKLHRGRGISKDIITLDKGIPEPIILIGSFMIKCPPFYFYDTGSDILLGNNFLQRFNKVIFDIIRHKIIFKTPCNHFIEINRLKRAYAKNLPILFKKRTAQRGDIDDLGYTSKPTVLKKASLILGRFLKTVTI